MGPRARLAGRRKDGSTFPGRVSLSPVATATGRFVLAVIRDTTHDQPGADLAESGPRGRGRNDARRGRELLGRVVGRPPGYRPEPAGRDGLPHDLAVQQIADALQRLDDTIREIHDHVFAAPPPGRPARTRRRRTGRGESARLSG